MAIEPVTFYGYCKSKNTFREFTFLYEAEDGEYSLLHGDCDFSSCPYSKECTVIRQALEKEDE